MKKLNQLTIKEASELLAKGEITSLELTESCLLRIEEIDAKVKACLTVCKEEARHAAKDADWRRSRGETGVLLGIPYIAKDNILIKGVRTTAASKILENYFAPYDATIIARLKAAGAVFLAKANLDEFAHGASTENSAFGPTHNPYDLERVPGGSSGGSAAAVAADMCLFALGTDTGGSIRCPAGFCGVAGLKPTYGRASRHGLIAMTSSTDVPGVLAKTSEDMAIVLKCLAGLDKNDSTTVDVAVPDYSSLLAGDVKGLKIGLPKEYFIDGIDADVSKAIKDAVDILKDQGAVVKEISLPHTKYGIAVYYIITPSEVSSNLARFDGIRYGLSVERADDIVGIYKESRGAGFGPEAKRRIMLGTYALSAGYYDAYYLKAQKVRTVIKEEIDAAFKEVDVLITPTSPHTAFKIGEQDTDPLKMYLEDVFVTAASLAGLPAISIPVGLASGLPIGMQIIGKRFDEGRLFLIGHAFESATDFHNIKPNI